MPYSFTSESVSEGHPDKVADQISDAILDNFLAFDPYAKVACETLVTTGQVVLAGEIKSNTYIDVQQVARDVINHIGYVKGEYMFEGNSCGVFSALHEQSPDINRGVDRGKPEEQGAGDQGMMFGYATNETENFMPLPLDLSHRILKELAALRRECNEIKYLRPDAKAQVTAEYDDNNVPVKILTIVLSTQHDEFILPVSDHPENIARAEREMCDQIAHDVKRILIPRVMRQLPPYIQKLFTDEIKFHVNPTGKFVIGGPHGDTGLTGRKIIVDTYGGKGAHGGGAFSGKDPSKVDRSAAYAARHIAKNIVAAGVADQVLVQVSYAIGVVEPMGIFVDTFGTSKIGKPDSTIADTIHKLYDLRPGMIEKNLNLRTPIYLESAAYGHMGRASEKVSKTFVRQNGSGKETMTVEVELFPWEKLDYVAKFREAFDI